MSEQNPFVQLMYTNKNLCEIQWNPIVLLMYASKNNKTKQIMW